MKEIEQIKKAAEEHLRNTFTEPMGIDAQVKQMCNLIDLAAAKVISVKAIALQSLIKQQPKRDERTGKRKNRLSRIGYHNEAIRKCIIKLWE